MNELVNGANGWRAAARHVGNMLTLPWQLADFHRAAVDVEGDWTDGTD